MGFFNNKAAGSQPNIMQMMSMLQGGGSPEAIMNAMAQNNPQAQQVMQQMKAMTNGKNPQDIQAMVMQLAKQKGMDVNQLLGMARQFGIKI